MDRTGGCRCGAIRYTLAAEPLATRLCWCRDCQYWALGNAAVNIVVPRAAVAVSGSPRGWESEADSGNRMRRSFCADCGTQLFSESSGNPLNMVIRVGTLDDARAKAEKMASGCLALFGKQLPKDGSKTG